MTGAGRILIVVAVVTMALLFLGPVGARYRISLTGAAYVLAGGILASRFREASAEDGRRPSVNAPAGPNESATA